MNRPRNFVLVHGAWHGGWCWSRVRDQLQDRGHRVFTPTLTGLADRSHLLSIDITLDTHIADVANVIDLEDLNDVILVGHSYGGWVISGAAERVLPRLASLVYVDAAFPDDGQSLVTDFGGAAFEERVRAIQGAGGIGMSGPSAAVMGIADPDDQMWVDSKTTEHPIGTYLTTIELTGGRERVARKTFVLATGYEGGNIGRETFRGTHDRLAQSSGWTVRQIKSSHDIMVDAPHELVEILLEEAAQAA